MLHQNDDNKQQNVETSRLKVQPDITDASSKTIHPKRSILRVEFDHNRQKDPEKKPGVKKNAFEYVKLHKTSAPSMTSQP